MKNITKNSIFAGECMIEVSGNTDNLDKKKIKMNLNFDINKIKIFEKVLFENLDTKIKTDSIEFDLITKNVLISMNNKTEKVSLSSKF